VASRALQVRSAYLFRVASISAVDSFALRPIEIRAVTHASKKGRRYTYYISQALTEGKRTKRIQRIPATEIEQVVSSRVRSLLASQVDLAAHFPDLSIREMRLLLAAARHRAELLTDLGTSEAKNIFKAIVKRVVMSESEAQIEIDRGGLYQELFGSQSPKHDLLDSTGICLVCPFTIKRRGQQVRMVISAGEEDESRPIPSLMRVIARSRDWAEQIVSGRARTLDDLIKTSGLTRPYVKNAFQCVALSPPLIDAILSGRHRVDLTVMDLTHDLPFDWNKQQF
jgi:site-specific DNA recombinase